MKNFNFKIVFVLIVISVFAVNGLFKTEKASASNSTLAIKSFVILNQSGVKGYDVGLALAGSTFNNASSIVVKLYSGNKLLQTNTAISGKITGTEFVTPFDVLGNFDYIKDGYYINNRENEYGKTLAATKVIALVTLSNGEALTATSTNLSGDPSTIISKGTVLGVDKYNFTLNIKAGSKGNEIIELQKFLNNAGYNIGTPNGYFGVKTKAATINFQIANNLKGDGIVGPSTRVFLNK